MCPMCPNWSLQWSVLPPIDGLLDAIELKTFYSIQYSRCLQRAIWIIILTLLQKLCFKKHTKVAGSDLFIQIKILNTWSICRENGRVKLDVPVMHIVHVFVYVLLFNVCEWLSEAMCDSYTIANKANLALIWILTVVL